MTTTESDTPSLRRPPALVPGDRVAVLTVSSPASQTLLPGGLEALRFVGLEPVVYDSALDPGLRHHYLAGADQQRATELRRVLTDDAVAGVIFAGGGYGAQRALELMDWTGLDRVAPKVLCGYSDVTAVLEAVAVNLGWASLMGPMVACSDFAEAYTFASMLRCLMNPGQVKQIHYSEAVTITGGSAQGVTLGGNLCLLSSSIGTPSCRPARGGILLVEDESEEDYRIDRMLTQLRRSGYLDGVSGIIAGTWDGCGEVDAVQAVLTDRLADLGVPVIAWANVGHGGHFQTYPIGVRATLDADRCVLTLDEPPLITHHEEAS